MRRKLEKEEGFAEGELVESWSGKRVLVGLVVLLLFLGAGYFVFSRVGERVTSVLGAKSTPVQRVAQNNTEVRLPNKEDADALLEKAKAELSSLTSEKVSSSPGALQDIIQDLQRVQSGKESPVGMICDLVCKH